MVNVSVIIIIPVDHANLVIWQVNGNQSELGAKSKLRLPLVSLEHQQE